MLKLIPALAREKPDFTGKSSCHRCYIAENMDDCTLMDVLSLYWDNEEFRLAFNAHCVRQPPTDHTWLTKYYKAFRAEDPPRAIAETIDLSETLYNLHKYLWLQTSNPLFVAICQSYARRLNVAHFSSWPWVSLVAFLRSGYPLDVRQRVFESIIMEYIGQSVTFSSVLESEHLMTLLSMTLLPQQRCRQLPSHIQQLLENVQKYQQLSNWLSGSDLASWTGVVPLIRLISVHRPSGWLCAMFDMEVLIWPMSKRDTSISSFPS